MPSLPLSNRRPIVGKLSPVVLAALQVTGELFEARSALESNDSSVRTLCDYVRPLLPPAKRQA